MNDLVIIVPVLRRPHRVEPLLESISKNTPVSHRVLFICSPDDFAETHALEKAGADFITIDGHYEGNGDYGRKINLGYKESEEPYIFLGADDLKFHPNWFENAVDRFNPRNGGRAQMAGTNDLGNDRVIEGVHATHTLVRRHYVDTYGTIDEPGKILHEGYKHNFCDVEFVETAKLRYMWSFASNSIVEHQHKDWGKAPDDDVYRLGREGFEEDRALYESRKHMWRTTWPR